MRYRETTGHLPFFKAKSFPEEEGESDGAGSGKGSAVFEKTEGVVGVHPADRQISE
jgi:hypothetical protein